MVEEATTFIIREEKGRTRPGARAYQRVGHLSHLFLPKQNTLWRVFAHIPLSDNKRDLRQRASLQIVVVVTLRELDAWVVLPLREENESVEAMILSNLYKEHFPAYNEAQHYPS